jgi:hypothetical protein
MPQSGQVILATRATDALITFLVSHDLQVEPRLTECRDALVRDDVDAALKAAYGIKPFGWGGLADQAPSPKWPVESQAYLDEVLRALVRHWMVHVSLLDRELPVTARLLRAVRKWTGLGVRHNQPMQRTGGSSAL